jgi:TPR repeat protein
MKTVSRFMLAVALLAVGLGAQAGLREGLDAYKSGDYPVALKEFRLLADQGVALGQYGLGMMYATGKGVARDYPQALALFRKAAEQGDAGAQNFLGVMYAKGQGVPQDYKQAVMWLRKAAEQGEVGAQNTLGLMYSVGQGMAADMVQAHKWFNLAEMAGNGLAGKNMEMAEHKMSREQIEQAQALAREWLAKRQ